MRTHFWNFSHIGRDEAKGLWLMVGESPNAEQ